MKKISDRMKFLISTIRVLNARKRSWSIKYNDDEREELLRGMFQNWFESTIEARRNELKCACRYAAAHPVLLARSHYLGVYNSIATAIANLICWAARTHNQTAVNTKINYMSKCWTDMRVDDKLINVRDWQLFSRPPRPRKEKAITEAAYAARKTEWSDDGFRDYTTQHFVSIRMNGREIARSGSEQVGACARAHGRIWWKILDETVWRRIMTTSAWPTFITLPETTTTYMEII